MLKKKAKRKPDPERGKEALRDSVTKDIEDIFAQTKTSDKLSAESAEGGDLAKSSSGDDGSIQTKVKAAKASLTSSHAVKEDQFSDIRGTKKRTLLLQSLLISQENGRTMDSRFTAKMN